MPLLRPKSQRKKIIGKRPYATISCPFNGHQVSWCRQLCTQIGDRGHCGRLAPHTMVGRTQAAILAYTARLRK